ncbi:uncharacterized protein LOC124705205 [Lolium rigidum]|uniref:uncharacterized protein LOC124705205 n=1 Tax=Lolium rigidum TaxID=89674 RepID=UPI001F5D62B5|nr:uncharacterized protein LOC124705205 [Lolium rigidum]
MLSSSFTIKGCTSICGRISRSFFEKLSVKIRISNNIQILRLPTTVLDHLSLPESVPEPAHQLIPGLKANDPRFTLKTISRRKMSSTTVTRAYLDHKLALAKRCSREATLAGAKAAAVATVASAVPTLASVRMLPWAKANLNPTGQALIVCTVAGMAYFVAADKKILALARRHSYEQAPDHLKDTSFPGAAARRRPAFFRP